MWLQQSAAPGRPVAGSGCSSVQEEEAALRQRRNKYGEGEASPVSELRGKDVRACLPAGSGWRGCPGETERVSGGRDTDYGREG
jgi:hypothetical protein